MNENLKPDEMAMLERAEKATKGPWATHDHNTMARRFNDKSEEWHGYAWVGYGGDSNGLFQGKVACLDRRRDGSEPFREAASPDADFIAAARTDLPTVLNRLANERAKLAIAMAALKRFTAFEPLADAALCRINELEK